MDGFEEKKWFVYMGDHHEGPFSLAEIQQKMSQGVVTSANYAWAEGMTDWKPMTDVPSFSVLLTPAAPPVAPFSPPEMVAGGSGGLDIVLEAREPAEPAVVAMPQLEAAPSAFEMPALEEAPVAAQPEPVAHPAHVEPTPQITAKPASAPAAADPAAIPANAIGAAPKKKGGLAKWAVFVALLLLISVGATAYMRGMLDPVLQSPGIQAGIASVKDMTQPALMKVAEKVPAVARFISPIPPIEDVTPEEYQELQAAAREKLESAGPRLALAMSRMDPLAPSFYIASNLPDGTNLDIYVEGIPDTLLNQTSFSAKVSATITKRLGKTGVVRGLDSKPLPRGEYILYVVEGEASPAEAKAAMATIQASGGVQLPDSIPKGVRLLTNRTFFLGGNKDALYASRLKEFHDKLQAKATAELNELKQFVGTLEGQFGSTTSKFGELQKMKVTAKTGAVRKNNWEAFHNQWAGLSKQMSETFTKWTPDALQKEFFYGMIYAQVLQASQTVENVHALHHSFFTTQVDMRSFEIQMGQAVSVAQNALAAVKAKVEQAEKISPTPNGMPRKEGL